MSKVTLRPTVPADLSHVIGEPLPYRIRAITALVDGRVIGMGGIAFPPRGPVIAFVQLAPARPARGQSSEDAAPCRDDRAGEGVPEAKRYPVAFHRAGLMAMAMIRASEAEQVIATADAGSDVAVRWLKRLGFKPADDQRIAGKLLFVWNRESDDDATGPQRRSSPQLAKRGTPWPLSTSAARR
jgi:hypothetical protein